MCQNVNIIVYIWFPNLAICVIAKIGGCTRLIENVLAQDHIKCSSLEAAIVTLRQFKLSHLFEIWQAHQHNDNLIICWRGACQISEQDKNKYKSCDFKRWWDLTIRRLIGFRSGFSQREISSVYLWCWWQRTKIERQKSMRNLWIKA